MSVSVFLEKIRFFGDNLHGMLESVFQENKDPLEAAWNVRVCFLGKKSFGDNLHGTSGSVFWVIKIFWIQFTWHVSPLSGKIRSFGDNLGGMSESVFWKNKVLWKQFTWHVRVCFLEKKNSLETV